MQKAIDIYAPLRNYTGYAEVVRNLVWRLYLQGWKINFKEFVGWASYRINMGPEFEKFFTMLEKNNCKSKMKLHICLPEQCRLEEGKININLTMFEAKRRLPELWLRCSHKLDYIIVPTLHNYRLWTTNMLFPYNKVYRSPFGVDVNAAKHAHSLPLLDSKTDEDLIQRYKYRILVLQEFISRKNLRGVLRAFYRACVVQPQRCEDTCLAIKINSNSGERLTEFKKLHDSVKAEVQNQFKVELQRNVFVYSKFIDEGEVYNFLSGFTHYFSMSFGEGWDLTCIKMAAMGKQLIVPESTSYMEYLDSDKAFMIPCIEDKIQIEEAPLIRIYESSFWDVPDVDIASKYISEIDTLPPRDAQKHVVENYSWDDATKHLSETLTNIENDGKTIKECDHSHFKEDIQIIACKSLGTPCGIAEYTKSLHMISNKGNKKLVTIGGDCFDTLVKVDKYRVHSVHIQNEYQFYSLERLQFMVKRMKEKRLYLTLTQHTFNENAYQYNKFFVENFDTIITHNKDVVDMYCKQFGENYRQHVIYTPMPVERVFDPEFKTKFDVKNGNLNLGFFGFCYYHKGLDRLLTAFHNVLSNFIPEDTRRDKIKLYVFSNKPQQDTVNYYEHCVSLLDALALNDNVQWMTNYVQIGELISSLHKLDVIYLPYDHYGSYGSSAALATCIQAERPRIICSNDSPYFDVGNTYEPNIVSCWNSDLEQHLQGVVDNYIDCAEKPVTDPLVWDRIFKDRNWVDMSEMLLGLGEKHGSLLQYQKD